jgi:hypothetical protein
MRLSGWPTPPLRRELCVGSAGVLPGNTAPNGGHATSSLSRNGAQPRTTMSEAVDGQEAASATSNNSAGRRIPQPRHAESTRALAGVLDPCTHAAQQSGPSDPFRQEITACFRRLSLRDPGFFGSRRADGRGPAKNRHPVVPARLAWPHAVNTRLTSAQRHAKGSEHVVHANAQPLRRRARCRGHDDRPDRRTGLCRTVCPGHRPGSGMCSARTSAD